MTPTAAGAFGWFRRPATCRVSLDVLIAGRSFPCTLGAHTGDDHAHRDVGTFVLWRVTDDNSVHVIRAQLNTPAGP
jgi:hypothetical protein